MANCESGQEGSWASYSLNKNKENHISPETALFMNDAATSFAVLSLLGIGEVHPRAIPGMRSGLVSIRYG